MVSSSQNLVGIEFCVAQYPYFNLILFYAVRLKSCPRIKQLHQTPLVQLQKICLKTLLRSFKNK